MELALVMELALLILSAIRELNPPVWLG